LSWQARIILAPVLAGQTLWHALASRRGTPWDVVTDGVLVGRCPTARDARQLLEAGVTAVLDLTSEYSEVRPLRQRVAYLNVPLLDMTVPSRHELRAALTFIRRQVSPPGGKGTVYIHCALGRYRSALIAAEYLRLRDGLTAEEAVGRLRRARKQIVIGPAELEHLHELTNRQRGQTGPNAVSSSV
jgi:protein-tyrosine phosphatase